MNEYYLDWANKSYADTLAAIAGPIAYAYYNKMPDALVYLVLKKLPDWMMDVCERFDEVVNKAEKCFHKPCGKHFLCFFIQKICLVQFFFVLLQKITLKKGG